MVKGRYEKFRSTTLYKSFDNVKKFATLQNDFAILDRIVGAKEENEPIYYHRKIKFQTFRRSVLIFPSGRLEVDMIVESDMDIVGQAALILRRAILNSKVNKLPDKVLIENLIKEECESPDILNSFLTTLIAAFNYRRRSSHKTSRLVSSFSSDLIFAVSNGRSIPSKQIVLGSSIKSLTNSKKIVKILHRYGHICSYDILEKLETEATYSSIEPDRICPSAVIRKQGLNTACAFDNFDRFIEISSNKTTLNDTVGIVYQNICIDNCRTTDNDVNQESIMQNGSQPQSSRKRKRTFNAFISELTHYSKKPRMESTLQPYNSLLRCVVPDNLCKVNNFDLLWMISHTLNIETPMWVGFNAM
ncbi:hypothetical protein TKK_0013514 [Trichogramma kaykai]